LKLEIKRPIQIFSAARPGSPPAQEILMDCVGDSIVLRHVIWRAGSVDSNPKNKKKIVRTYQRNGTGRRVSLSISPVQN